MRFSAFLGSLLAGALASVSYDTTATLMPEPTKALALPDIFRPDLRGYYQSRGHGGAKTLRHTGAGGAGMRRAWKRRRASGLL